MMHLSVDLRQPDQMQRQCLSLVGAKSRAEWLLKADPALRKEFDSAEPLAGLLMSRARYGVGVCDYAEIGKRVADIGYLTSLPFL